MFFHQPYGTFDFSGSESKFQPKESDKALPIELFFIGSGEPTVIMGEYARHLSETRFSWKSIARQILKVYDQLLEKESA